MDDHKGYNRTISVFPNVIRQQLLHELFERLNFSLTNQCTYYAEIIGDAGTGKSVFLNQINPFLKYNGIFSQYLQIPGSETLNVLESVTDEAKTQGIQLNEIETYEKYAATYLYKLLVGLKSPQKDVLILVIDDAHLLSKESLNLLRKVFYKIPGSRLFLVLCGRPGFESETPLKISNFNDEEFQNYFTNLLHPDWILEHPDLYTWFSSITEMHPYRVSLLVNICIDKGLLSATYAAPMDMFMNMEFPKDLVEAIRSKYRYAKLSSDEQKVMTAIAHSYSGWKQSELKKILGKSCQKALRSLTENQWVLKDKQRIYRVVHPVLKEWVQSKTKDKRLEIYQKILTSGVLLSLGEKSAYLLMQNAWSKSERDTLLDYVSELEQSGFYFSANEVLSKLDPKYSHLETGVRASVNYASLNQMETAKTILEKLKTHPESEESWKINNYLGYFALAGGKINDAESIFLEGLSLENLPEDGFVRLNYRLALVYANQWNLDKVHETVAILKEYALKKPEWELLYRATVANLNTNIPMEIDTEPFIQDGITLAKSRGDQQQAAYFNIALCSYYIRMTEFEKLETVGKELLQYGIDLFDTNIQFQAHYLLALGYLNGENYVPAIQHMEQALAIMEKTGIAYNRDSALTGLAQAYVNIGCGTKEKDTFTKLRSWIKDYPTPNMEARVKLALHELRDGNEKQGISDLKSIIMDCTENGNDVDRLNAEAFLSCTRVKKEPQKALADFQETIAGLKKQNVDGFLPRKYFEFAFSLGDNAEKEMLSVILEKWERPDQPQHLILLPIVKILKSALNGKHRAMMAQVRNMEEAFIGKFLHEYHRLYRFLAEKADTNNKAVKRYQFISDCLDVIIAGKHKQFPPKNTYGKDGFAGLMYAWARAIHDDIPFSSEFVVENDYPWLEQTLSVWDIQIEDESQIGLTDGTPIVINLLGKMELTINGKRLTGKDWTSRKVLEVLAYLILNGYKYRTSVLKEDLLRDVWPSDSDTQSQTMKYKNVTLTRLRNLFKDCKEDFIIETNDHIGINWESENFRLDIEHFERAYKRGMELKKSGRTEEANSHFEIAKDLYHGPVADTLGGLWIEPYRATFFQMKEDVLDNLM